MRIGAKFIGCLMVLALGLGGCAGGDVWGGKTGAKAKDAQAGIYHASRHAVFNACLAVLDKNDILVAAKSEEEGTIDSEPHLGHHHGAYMEHATVTEDDGVIVVKWRTFNLTNTTIKLGLFGARTIDSMKKPIGKTTEERQMLAQTWYAQIYDELYLNLKN